jgi:peptide/nickel transport system permease protein
MPIFWFGIMLQVFISTMNNSFTFLPNLPYHERVNSLVFGPTQMPKSILFGALPPTGFFTIDSLLSFKFNLFIDVIAHLISPAFVLSLGLMAILSRMTRMAMVEVLRQDYILLAKSKGLRERIILYRHAFRNALLPTLTVAGLALAGLLTGAVLTETVFDWPGIGTVAANAILRLDLAALQGFVILTAILYVLSNLAVDLLYGFIDPRIRYD